MVYRKGRSTFAATETNCPDLGSRLIGSQGLNNPWELSFSSIVQAHPQFFRRMPLLLSAVSGV